jgi:hypothetical protein
MSAAGAEPQQDEIMLLTILEQPAPQSEQS